MIHIETHSGNLITYKFLTPNSLKATFLIGRIVPREDSDCFLETLYWDKVCSTWILNRVADLRSETFKADEKPMSRKQLSATLSYLLQNFVSLSLYFRIYYYDSTNRPNVSRKSVNIPEDERTRLFTDSEPISLVFSKQKYFVPWSKEQDSVGISSDVFEGFDEYLGRISSKSCQELLHARRSLFHDPHFQLDKIEIHLAVIPVSRQRVV